MSFLYDPKVYEKIIKFAQNPLIKEEQKRNEEAQQEWGRQSRESLPGVGHMYQSDREMRERNTPVTTDLDPSYNYPKITTTPDGDKITTRTKKTKSELEAEAKTHDKDNPELAAQLRALINQAPDRPGPPEPVQEPGTKPAIRDLAARLIGKLENELTGKPNITADVKEGQISDVPLTTTNVKSLSLFLKYLADNDIRVDGVKTAYTQEDIASQNIDVGALKLSKISGYTGRVESGEEERHLTTQDYFINTPAVVKYLSFLQQKAQSFKDSQNRSEHQQGNLLIVMVGALIDELNRYGDTGLVRKPKSQPGKPNVIPDETPIDSFAYKSLDPKDPARDGPGTITLFAKDIKNRESLNNWIASEPVASVMLGTGETRMPVKLQGTQFTQGICLFLNAMLSRAQAKLNQAKSTTETANFNYYVNQLKSIIPSFTGENNQACTIGIGEGEGAKSGKESTMSEAQRAAQLTQMLNGLITALPFNRRTINFPAIQKFFGILQSIVGTSVDPNQYPRHAAILSRINAAEQAMDAVAKLSKQPPSDFPLASNPQTISTEYAKSTTSYKDLIDQLKSVLDNTMATLSSFREAFGQQLKDNPKIVEAINEQIGVTATSPSIYGENLTLLSRLRSQDPLDRPTAKPYWQK